MKHWLAVLCLLAQTMWAQQIDDQKEIQVEKPSRKLLTILDATSNFEFTRYVLDANTVKSTSYTRKLFVEITSNLLEW